MRSKMGFVAGLGVGYLLGTRAGRDKFDQIVGQARKAWDHPTIQEAAGVLRERAQRLYDNSRQAMTERMHKMSKQGEESQFEQGEGEKQANREEPAKAEGQPASAL